MSLKKSLNIFNTYDEYINSWIWKEKTEELKKIDKVCKLCGSNKYLQVHHKNYDSFGNEKKRDLILLCHECHKMLHNIK